jgi:hypothetical protein
MMRICKFIAATSCQIVYYGDIMSVAGVSLTDADLRKASKQMMKTF